MGASAGGLEAFQKFFSNMPANSGMAFVLAQHLDPRHETLMPELLRKQTTMSVVQSIFLVIVTDAVFSIVFLWLDL